ncbi:MAG: hypothetical protein ACPLSJ_06415 [Thermosulfidibacteraceae bacterium]|jgi:NOL1/NOP2/fmu family ribosome biogenesis protein
MKNIDIIKKIVENFDIDEEIFKNFEFEIIKDVIWIHSKKIRDLEVSHSNRKGLRFGNILKDKSIRISFFTGQLFGRFAKKRVVELNEEELVLFMRGLDIENRWNYNEGQVIVRFSNISLGTATITGNILKPQVPTAKRLKV